MGIVKKIIDRDLKMALSTGRAGFTLVEMLVSIAVFSMAMGVVTQLFLYSMHIQRFLVAHAQMVNEMSYNLEHISRGLRMAKKSQDTNTACLPQGSNYETTVHNETGATTYGIKFLNPKLAGGVECVEYYLGHPADYPAGAMALMEKRDGGTWSFDLPLTSPDVKILAFTVAGTGWSQDDTSQPRVTVYVQSQSKEKEILENQITVSQRDIDVRE